MFRLFPINSKAACGVLCALVSCVYAHNAASNSGDRLEAETAVRLREFAKNNSMGDRHRPMSPEMQVISRNPDLVANLTAEGLAKMTLDDPLLKWAYARVFLDSMGPFEQLDLPRNLALADMRRRGEAVSPMFLKLIVENQENRIESSILGKVEHLETISLEPFLKYARKLLRERTQSDVVAVASGLLARHGSKEDIGLLEWVLTQRPFAVTDLTGNLKILRSRLDPAPETRPERREIPSSNTGADARSAESAENHPHTEDSAIYRTKLWIIGGVILVVLMAACRFLHQRLRGQSS